MIAKSKRTYTVCAVGLFTAVCLLFAAALLRNTTAGVASADVFVPSEAVSVQSNQAIGTGLVSDTRTGVLLSASSSGASVDLAGDQAGAFEIDFRAFTDTATSDANTLASSGFKPASDLRTLTLKFTDKQNAANAFDIIIDAGSDITGVPQARIRANGTDAGIFRRARFKWNGPDDHNLGRVGNLYYVPEAAVSGETKLANTSGLYTYLTGATFVNAAFIKGVYTAQSDSAVIGFDPVSMSVYGYVRDDGGRKKVTVWDFSSPENDGRDIGFTLGGFASYNVSMEFTAVAAGKTARLMIYAVNGQTLGATEINDDTPPGVFAKVAGAGVAGSNYSVPAPTAFDVKDGTIEQNTIKTEAFDASGAPVALMGLGGGGTFAAGCYFNPLSAGIYTIRYTAKDRAGNERVFEINPEIFLSVPANTYIFDVPPQNQTVGTGTALTIAVPRIYNALKPAESGARVEILKDGGKVFDEIRDSAVTYLFDSAGLYTVSFSADSLPDSYSYTVTVSDALPAFTASAPLVPVAYLGDRIVLPTVMADRGGQSVMCESRIEFPDGTRYKNREFAAPQLGTYTVEYKASFDQTEYMHTVRFTVVINAGALFTNVSNAGVSAGGTAGGLSDDLRGISVTTAGPGVVRYAREIDFNGRGKDDIFLEFIVTPAVFSAADFVKLRVRLTDATDPNNSVTIETRTNLDMATLSNVKASASGQPLKGLESGDSSNLRAEDAYGTWVNHSFFMRADTVKLSMNYANREVFANGVKVVGLADPAHFPVAWNGFNGGKAILTIETAQVVSGASASFVVLNVDGLPLAQNEATDTGAPEISLNFGAYSESNLPAGAIGKPYPVFGATAKDRIDGAVPVTCGAYALVGNIKTAVSITGGSFTPARSGKYIIEYTARDTSGNTAIKTVNITVLQTAAPVTIALSKDSDAGMRGVYYEFPDCTLSGGHGQKSLSVSILTPSGGVFAPETISGFTPYEEGIYNVTFTGTDFLGQTASAELELDVGFNALPVIGAVSLPRYIIAGEKFVFPDFTAVDYTQAEAVSAQKEIWIIYNGETALLPASREFIPVPLAAGHSPLTVRYLAKNQNGEEGYVDYNLTVVRLFDSDGKSQIPNYFAGENITSGFASAPTYSTNASGASMEFLRPIAANGFLFEFNIPAGFGNTDKITVRLHSAANRDNFIEIEIFNKGGATSYMRVNGGYSQFEVAGAFGGAQGFRLSYDPVRRTLLSAAPETGADMEISAFREYTNGKPFDVFGGGLLILEIKFGAVSGGSAGIAVTRLCNQTFTAESMEDLVRPLLYVAESYGTMTTKDEKITVYPAFACDVLSAAGVTVSVRDPSGVYLLRDMPCNTAYEITVEKYGYYNITYYVYDGADNIETFNVSLYSVCYLPLTMEVGTGLPATADLNGTINIPAFTVTSPFFSAEQISKHVYLITPDYTFIPVKDLSAGIKLTQKGKYTVRFYAADPDGNTVFEDVTVVVS